MKLFSNIGFYIGMLVGVTIAGAGFYMMSDEQEAPSESKEVVSNEPEKGQLTAYSPDKQKTPAKANRDYEESQKEKAAMLEVITVGDSMVIDSIEIATVDTVAETVDSLNMTLEDPVIVRKDVLMRTLSFNLPVMDTAKTIIDTLAEDLNIVESVKHDQFDLELWESPIGYLGYKMSGNKILVFGIDTAKNINLKRAGDDLNLHVGKQIYKIEQKSEFVELKGRM